MAAVNLWNLCNWVDLNEYNVQLFLIMKLKKKKKNFLPLHCLEQKSTKQVTVKSVVALITQLFKVKKIEWVLASSTVSLLLHYTKDLKVNKDLKIFF